MLHLALDLDAGAFGEGHVEEGVEGLTVLGAHLQRGGDEVPCASVADSEEVPNWNQHAWLHLSIPVHLEDEPAQEIRLGGGGGPTLALVGNGDPDMIDGARAAYLGKRRRLGWC